MIGVRREAATVVQGTTIKMSDPTLVTHFSIVAHGWPVSHMMGRRFVVRDVLIVVYGLGWSHVSFTIGSTCTGLTKVQLRSI